MPDDLAALRKQELKADIYYKLAERARMRLEERRKTEWKAAFGLWTALGVAIGFTITSSWIPSCLDIVCCVAFAVILSICVVFWMRWLQRTFRLDTNTSLFWEGLLEDVANIKKPDTLTPDFKTYLGLHIVRWVHILVTAILVFAFFGEAYEKHKRGEIKDEWKVNVSGPAISGSPDIGSADIKKAQ